MNDPRDPEHVARKMRNGRLSDSDWTQLPDAPITNADAWKAYRQMLRDLPDNPDWPNMEWPTPPDA